MFICICNQLKEREVAAVVENGVSTLGDMFKALGCAPRCGMCVPYLQECMEDVCCRTTVRE